MTTLDIEKEISDRGVPLSAQGIYRRALSGSSRKASIQAMCLECQGYEDGARKAIRDCPSVGCPLWSVRPYQAKDEDDVERESEETLGALPKERS